MISAGRLIRWALQPLLLSLAILVAAWLLASSARSIPPSFYGLWLYGPRLALAGLTVLGVVYRQGRVLLIALLLALGLSLQNYANLPAGAAQVSLRDIVITVMVPLNLALIGWLKERGLLTVFTIVRLSVVLGQLLLLAGWWRLWPESFNHAVARSDSDWLHAHIGAQLQYPQIGYLAMTVGGISLLASAWRQGSHLAFGLLVAYGGYVSGILRPDHPGQLHAGSIAIGLILCIAILRDTYNLAYRDELTGLPQRRSLNELCLSLSGDYAVAMIDVDRFKKFNDKHGHDTGDDVLKMVAAQIARVREGGRAFRYGGEEFTVVYPSRTKEQALNSLEQVREAIQDYEMVIRPPRPASDALPIAKRGKGGTNRRMVSVTISIGVADRSDRSDRPDDVLKKADQALYRAKKAGRNRVAVWTEKRLRKERSQAG